MENSTTFELNLPGFRFHPTEEEFLNFYLKNMIYQKKPLIDVISFLNIYHHDPWDLPGLAKTRTGEREWYFFVPRDRKKGKQGRPNRTTENGFWKATGSDRKVISLSNPKKMIGMKKTMVFYRGRAPRGCKTDWVMNEFRLPDTPLSPTDIVLCKIYRKATSLKVLEQRAAVAVEEETLNIISQLLLISPPSLSSPSSSSSSMDHQDLTGTAPQMAVEKEENGQQQQALEEEENDLFLVGNYYHSKKKEEEEEEETAAFGETIGTSTGSGIRLPFGQEKLENLLVPTKSSTVDWTQDLFWTQLRSPWLDNWAFYANALSTSNEYF